MHSSSSSVLVKRQELKENTKSTRTVYVRVRDEFRQISSIGFNKISNLTNHEFDNLGVSRSSDDRIFFLSPESQCNESTGTN